MIPSEIDMRGIQYLAPENQFLVPPYNNDNNNNNNNNLSCLIHTEIPTFHDNLNTLLTNIPIYSYNNSNFPCALGTDFIVPHNSSCLSSNSTTSDEADELPLSVIDERKQRRMISNRESARRSRMRKQKHLDELWSQVVRLRSENHNLIDKLNNMSESHDRVLQENARLKEEASDLRQMIAEISGNSFGCVVRGFDFDDDVDDDNNDNNDNDDVPCKNTTTTKILRDEETKNHVH
ncbi:hypothetical protein HN51_069976 [Arachis hypogaea]|uniref:BZIP domain-containing protein n=2 Tax=Arachis hypogaea TaxID=3818 RepID=A0A444Z3V5_ARAHY|nr:basic leucine zipper 43-like [Arachis ipaensis]XP_025654986.1 basic leucine zipper 43 [Arachis hypogaea]QHO12307.1 Basic leucine zipper [Arachis hypogaea]RYR08855.1 hypothetical protein Ahy_B05g076692 isoform B [Arachis hypogaea]